MTSLLQTHAPVVVARGTLDRLITLLRERGFRVLGPSVRDQAIVYDDLADTGALPIGWTEEQEAGRYRLVRRTDQALFGYTVGPHAWKRFLHPPLVSLWRAKRENSSAAFTVDNRAEPTQPLAIIGARACELHAIDIQDRVFLGGNHVDPHYRARREGLFVVAVNCAASAPTCFCVAMNTGPNVTSGASRSFDLALTELLDANGHRFLLEVGSEPGATLVAQLESSPATEADLHAARALSAHAASQQTRSLPTSRVRELLRDNLEHPQWDDVAERCLSCGNCTMVCPTCFCTSVEDVTQLAGNETERVRKWDSCFTADFSYQHGGPVRQSTKARYRQWLTHKLSTWIDQFGTSGCVGCGRCISWCPTGIDLTAEVAALASPPDRSSPASRSQE